MFSRRKSRSVHGTAYTGVNHVAPESSQPNSGALAAALTIGQNIKNGGNGTISRNSSLTTGPQRTSSIQSYRSPPTNIGTSSSLLKRSPANNVTGKRPQSQSFQSIGNGNQHFKNFSSVPTRNSYGSTNVNDLSFGDGSLNEITEEDHYNNHETVKDLKLSHNKQSGNEIKMVKKYIPTPNGIKIIEVPESNMQKEIIRNNSIRRSGSINSFTIPPRTAKRKPSSRLSSLVQSPPLGLMREESESESLNLNNKRFAKAKSPEQLELESLQQKIQDEENLSKNLELKRLQYEELRAKRLADESKLKQMESEINNLDHQQNKSPDGDAIQQNNENLGIIPDVEPEEQELTSSSPLLVVERPILNDLSTIETDPDNNFISPTVSNLKDNESSNSDYPSLDPTSINDNEETKGKTNLDNDVTLSPNSIDPNSIVVDELESNELITENAIDASKLKVDEVDIKKSSDLDDYINDTLATNVNESQIDESQVDNTLNKDNDEDFSKEVVDAPFEDSIILDKEPRPTFDVIPSIITDETNDNTTNDTVTIPPPNIGSTDTIDNAVPDDSVKVDNSLSNNELRAPSFNNVGSSASSISSDASPSRLAKKPMKSAMKTSSSFYNTSSVSSQSTTNAAHDAYLSLTTAENTRLNSKLSSSQLNDMSSTTYTQSHHYPTSSSLNKRMSTTLRKSPSTNINNSSSGLANKTLRPTSLQAEGPQRNNGNGFQNVVNGRPTSQAVNLPNVNNKNNSSVTNDVNGSNNTINGATKSRMSNRSLRDRSSVYVEPIKTHPSLDPNYQSPSKLKAAELYAKANKRPVSTFNLQRKSSFSNEHSSPSDGKVMSKTTLRDPPSSQQPTQQTNHLKGPSQVPQNQNIQNHHQASQPKVTTPTDSRFADSDDEEPVLSPDSAFSSRNVNSIKAAPPPKFDNNSPNKYQDPILSLRAHPGNKKESSNAPKEKEKKKIGGRLKKLFGRS